LRLNQKSLDDQMSTTRTSPLKFIAQVRHELTKITWPSRREVWLTTIMVFILAALTATIFSLIDLFIRWGLGVVVGA
jgi:preprotein translocase subunit SecE